MRPDLTALGKVIGGGLPVGAFGGRAEIMDQLSPIGPVYQAGTLSGNPLAMAAGLAQLRELERIDGWAIARETRRAVRRSDSRDRCKTTSCRSVFHRIGSMFCLFFTQGPVTRSGECETERSRQRSRVFQPLPGRGVYFAPSQFETGFLSTAHQPARSNADGARSCARRSARRRSLGGRRAKSLRPSRRLD